jgi:hypothetical protein
MDVLLQRATDASGEVSRPSLAQQLDRLEDAIRGGENRFLGLRLQIIERIEKTLGPNADLATRMKILFQPGKGLPF